LSTAVQKLIEELGYSRSPGYVAASDFDQIPSNRLALLAARDQMDVVGCFGLWTQRSANSRQFFPLVYVAAIADDDVRPVHRRVWNQDTVPYLLVVTPSGVVACDGFAYSSQFDRGKREGERFRIPLQSLTGTAARELLPYTARSLQSSVAWRDRTIDISGRVDHRLLKNIFQLVTVLTEHANPLLGSFDSQGLNVTLAHGLVGRFIYLNFLLDRQILTEGWLKRHGLSWPAKDTGHPPTVSAFRKIWRALDETFNGSIFPFNQNDWAQIQSGHLRLVHEVMRHSDVVASEALQQLLFNDFDFSSLRIETLSAVYEQFLHRFERIGGEELGAHYTAPFLADFVFDMLEAEEPLTSRHKVLDCAAGSGVFLVAAYRRMIESALPPGHRHLRIAELRRILSSNVFGVELVPDACHVAAFSLYLTMLDYCAPNELVLLERASAGRQLFPSLFESNLIPLNFFAGSLDAIETLPKAFDVVVTNPPWASIKPGSVADKYSIASGRPVGDRQVAELFLWKVLDRHLVPNGRCAMVLPSKSFVNPSSALFRKELFSSKAVLGIADFSNLRYVLFQNAKHPPTIVFVKNVLPVSGATIWHYVPLRATQIGATGKDLRQNKMWSLLVDPSEMSEVGAVEARLNPNLWAGRLHGRDVDWRILSYMRGLGERKGFTSLGALKRAGVIGYSRGGNEPEHGVPPKFVLSSNENDPNYYLSHLQQDGADLIGRRDSALVPLPKRIKPKKAYRQRFGGNIVLLPRILTTALFVGPRIAYTSSFIGIWGEKGAANLLQAIAKISRSKVAKYYLMLSAPRYLIDRPNIEPSVLDGFPLPFVSPNDPRIEEFLKITDVSVDDALFAAFELSGAHKEAIQEFMAFRIGFKDGGVPPRAFDEVNSIQASHYGDVVKEQLNRMVRGSGSYRVSVTPIHDQGIGIVFSQFVGRDQPSVAEASSKDLIESALASFHDSGFTSVGTSLAMRRLEGDGPVLLAKPLRFLNWTAEQAFRDASIIARSAIYGEPIGNKWRAVRS
jgi:N-6 DNA Methylase